MGRSTNPVDAHRREQRRREIKKNKAARLKQRDLKVARECTSAQVQASIDALEHKRTEKMGYLEATEERRLERLRKELKIVTVAEEERAKKKREAEETATITKGDVVQEGPNTKSLSNHVTPEMQGVDPRMSVYYHPTMNPYGAPPPGKPTLYHKIGGGVTMDVRSAFAPPTCSNGPGGMQVNEKIVDNKGTVGKKAGKKRRWDVEQDGSAGRTTSVVDEQGRRSDCFGGDDGLDGSAVVSINEAKRDSPGEQAQQGHVEAPVPTEHRVNSADTGSVVPSFAPATLSVPPACPRQPLIPPGHPPPPPPPPPLPPHHTRPPSLGPHVPLVVLQQPSAVSHKPACPPPPPSQPECRHPPPPTSVGVDFQALHPLRLPFPPPPPPLPPPPLWHERSSPGTVASHLHPPPPSSPARATSKSTEVVRMPEPSAAVRRGKKSKKLMVDIWASQEEEIAYGEEVNESDNPQQNEDTARGEGKSRISTIKKDKVDKDLFDPCCPSAEGYADYRGKIPQQGEHMQQQQPQQMRDRSWKKRQRQDASTSLCTVASKMCVDRWYYQDNASGALQGPFDSRTMMQWNSAGYFPLQTPVRNGESGAFLPLVQTDLSAPLVTNADLPKEQSKSHVHQEAQDQVHQQPISSTVAAESDQCGDSRRLGCHDEEDCNLTNGAGKLDGDEKEEWRSSWPEEDGVAARIAALRGDKVGKRTLDVSSFGEGDANKAHAQTVDVSGDNGKGNGEGDCDIDSSAASRVATDSCTVEYAVRKNEALAVTVAEAKASTSCSQEDQINHPLPDAEDVGVYPLPLSDINRHATDDVRSGYSLPDDGNGDEDDEDAYPTDLAYPDFGGAYDAGVPSNSFVEDIPSYPLNPVETREGKLHQQQQQQQPQQQIPPKKVFKGDKAVIGLVPSHLQVKRSKPEMGNRSNVTRRSDSRGRPLMKTGQSVVSTSANVVDRPALKQQPIKSVADEYNQFMEEVSQLK